MIASTELKAALTATVALCALGWIMTGPARAQQPPQMSEDAVKKYMDYAWEMLPDKFTKPDGALIVIDKTARSKVDIPVDTGRDAIMAGRRTAYAQSCGFREEQIANYRSLMIREETRKKWSEPQLMFINQIHMTTGMLLNGTIRLVETDAGGKEIKVEEETAPKINKPTDQVCNDILDQIATYVKAGPPIPYNPAAADAAATAAAATAGAKGAPAAAAKASSPAATPAAKAAGPSAAPATTGATGTQPPKKP